MPIRAQSKVGSAPPVARRSIAARSAPGIRTGTPSSDPYTSPQASHRSAAALSGPWHAGQTGAVVVFAAGTPGSYRIGAGRGTPPPAGPPGTQTSDRSATLPAQPKKSAPAP